MRRAALASMILLLILLLPQIGVEAWSNGGYSADPNNPDYGTHDWIAQHALDWLPAEKKQYITDNLASYLYGTELPDLSSTQGGIGDTTKHHIYYSANGTLIDEAAAIRAENEYRTTLNYLRAGNYSAAALHAGAMTHYIADMAVFGHVMGESTDWGTEAHHSDYENHVNTLTSSYTKRFIKALQYDGRLTKLSASNAAKRLALDTTLDGSGMYTASWMDDNYNWTSTAFTTRAWESVNLATNEIADTLSTLYDEYSPQTTKTSITCTLQNPPAKENEKITISGRINATVTTTITVSQYKSNKWMEIASANTTNGAYTTTLQLRRGYYQIRATWQGNSRYEGATSRILSFNVTAATGSIKITIVDSSNKPIVGATVTSTSTPSRQAALTGTTSSKGTITFSDIAVGTYTFNATKNGYNLATINEDVTESGVATGTISLSEQRSTFSIPGFPVEAIIIGVVLFLGYSYINRMNRYKLNNNKINK